MARDTGEDRDTVEGAEDGAEASHEPRECMPCRGTGEVISHLGGTASTVTCPWCGGGGVRVPGVDAQARWLDADGERAESDTPAEPAAQ
jgi:DnaJ-class molecular chaperone